MIPTMNIANKIHNASSGNAINPNAILPVIVHIKGSLSQFHAQIPSIVFTIVPTIKAMNTAKIVIKDANKMI